MDADDKDDAWWAKKAKRLHATFVATSSSSVAAGQERRSGEACHGLALLNAGRQRGVDDAALRSALGAVWQQSLAVNDESTPRPHGDTACVAPVVFTAPSLPVALLRCCCDAQRDATEASLIAWRAPKKGRSASAAPLVAALGVTRFVVARVDDERFCALRAAHEPPTVVCVPRAIDACRTATGVSPPLRDTGPSAQESRPIAVAIPGLPGCLLVADAVGPAQEVRLLGALGCNSDGTVTDAAWAPLNGRFVRHYGHRFVYGANDHATDGAAPWPADWAGGILATAAAAIATADAEAASALQRSDQVTANAYPAGSGIPSHVDDTVHFGPVVASLSLHGHAVMRFAPADATTAGEPLSVLLPPRWLLVLTGDARTRWAHGIASVASDVVPAPSGAAEPQILPRTPRVSVTFRQTVPSATALGGEGDRKRARPFAAFE